MCIFKYPVSTAWRVDVHFQPKYTEFHLRAGTDKTRQLGGKVVLMGNNTFRLLTCTLQSTGIFSASSRAWA